MECGEGGEKMHLVGNHSLKSVTALNCKINSQ